MKDASYTQHSIERKRQQLLAEIASEEQYRKTLVRELCFSDVLGSLSIFVVPATMPEMSLRQRESLCAVDERISRLKRELRDLKDLEANVATFYHSAKPF